MKKLGIGVLAIALLFIIVPAQSNADSGENEIKVGILSHLTGVLAGIGIPFHTAQQFVAEDINAQGGLLVDGKKYKIRVILEDTKGEIPTTRAVGEKLVFKDKVKFMLVTGDPIDWVIESLTTRAKVLMLTATWNRYLIGSSHPYTYGTLPSPLETAAGLFGKLKEREPHVKTVHYLGFNAKYDTNAASWARERDEGMGFKWLGETFVEFDVTDWTGPITGILAKKPDMIEIGTIADATPAAVKTIRQLGYKGVLGSSFSGKEPRDLLAAMKGEEHLLDGFYDVSFGYEPPTPATEQYLERYAKKTGSAVGANASAAQTPTSLVLFKAIQDAGTFTDPDKVAWALENVRVPYPYYPNTPELFFAGRETYGARKQLAVPSIVVMIKDGKIHNLGISENVTP